MIAPKLYRTGSVLFVWIVLMTGAWTGRAADGEDLAAAFRNPPREAGVRCWWWWLNSNVTKEAITRDLEAMHDKGFSGAMIFDAGTELRWGPDQNVPNGPVFAGPEWTELFLHALREAKRLDLELGLSIQSGWNLGGPFVTLDDKAKQITWSEIQADGGAPLEIQLPIPKANYDYYRDIVVLAWPTKSLVANQSVTLRARSQQADFPVGHINSGQFWVSAGKNPGEGPTAEQPEWIQVSFEEDQTITALQVEGRKGYGPKVCRLVAMDSQQVAGPFKLKDGANRLTFAPLTGRTFRVVFEDAYDPTFPESPRNVQVTTLQLIDETGRSLLGGVRNPIRDLAAKSGARELGGSAPDCRFLLDDVPAMEGEADALLEEVIDLSDQLGADGVLKWNAPAGNWTILRIGYTPTLAHVATSSDNWKGHVLDYLSTDAFERYWNQTMDPLLKKAGPLAGTVLKQLETDSWECGGMNWSPGFAEDFQRTCGYDLTRYLPVVAGKIIESREVSNAFLADLRKTIAHCVSENHYRVFAEHAARYNLGIQPECSGPHAAPIDGITNYKHSDIVMSEFWIPSPHRPNPENRFFVKQAASAAHIYGKQLVGAESFTSVRKPHWADVLWRDLKPAMDYEYCEGLNLIFFHTFTCSPKEMGIPGQEYFAGTHVNPQVTWWDYSDAFMEYMNRIQTVVQRGQFVADVLYYYGDHVPNIAVYKGFNRAGALPGYDYDVTNEEVLLEVTVRDGQLIVPGGIHYRLLVLPDHKVLSLAALEQVERLLQQGATVLGPKPERLVSLVGGPEAQRKFHALADRLWGEQPASVGHKAIGTGTLVWGQTAREFLQADGVATDFEVRDRDAQLDFQYIHYRIGASDIYFVSNQMERPQTVSCAFRISGKRPELWDPVTGQIMKAEAYTQADGRTMVPMAFAPYGSCLVVFRDSIPVSKQGSKPSNYPTLQTVQTIPGPWTVTFDPAWGGPDSAEFKSLIDWTRHADDRIKYYSGAATYTRAFELHPISEKRYWLQLNQVQDVGIAAIRLNGEELGTTWTRPFRQEITCALTPGINHLEITVVNSWLNRLIGDRGKPQAARYTRTNIHIRDDWNLTGSGLLGPVEIKRN